MTGFVEVRLLVRVPSQVRIGFEEQHFHRFIDTTPDLTYVTELVDQYAQIEGAEMDLTYLDPLPEPKLTHPGPIRMQ